MTSDGIGKIFQFVTRHSSFKDEGKREHFMLRRSPGFTAARLSAEDAVQFEDEAFEQGSS